MQENTEARRLKLLKLEGDGLLKPEIVKELSAEFEVTIQTCYRDFRTRNVWQPITLETEKAIHKILNRHEQLYRKVSALRLDKEITTMQQLYILNQMRIINKDFFIFCCPEGAKNLEAEQFDGYLLRWKKKIEATSP